MNNNTNPHNEGVLHRAFHFTASQDDWQLTQRAESEEESGEMKVGGAGWVLFAWHINKMEEIGNKPPCSIYLDSLLLYNLCCRKRIK